MCIHLLPTRTFATADPKENTERHTYFAILPIRTVTRAVETVAQHCGILLLSYSKCLSHSLESYKTKFVLIFLCDCFSFFTLSATTYCDTNEERNDMPAEQYVRLLITYRIGLPQASTTHTQIFNSDCNRTRKKNISPSINCTDK
jgi:hypothetical protein